MQTNENKKDCPLMEVTVKIKKKYCKYIGESFTSLPNDRLRITSKWNLIISLASKQFFGKN